MFTGVAFAMYTFNKYFLHIFDLFIVCVFFGMNINQPKSNEIISGCEITAVFCMVNHGFFIMLVENNYTTILLLFVCRSYSYYIEVSMEQKDWFKIIDYSQMACRSWQYLYFEDRVVQYVRIVGTHNTVNRVCH